MAEFVERDLKERNFYGRQRPDVIFEGDAYQKKRRKENKKMIERGQGIEIDDLTQVSNTINAQGRRSRGKGRRINPKQ